LSYSTTRQRANKESILLTTQNRKAAIELASKSATGKNMASVREMGEAMAKTLLAKNFWVLRVKPQQICSEGSSFSPSQLSKIAEYSALLDSTEQNMARLNKKLEDEREWLRKKGLQPTSGGVSGRRPRK
jgi:hypothetical protein